MKKRPRYPQKTAPARTPKRTYIAEKNIQDKIPIIIKHIQQTHDCSKFDTLTLKQIHIFIREVAPQLFSANQYVEARQMILVGEEVDNELELRNEIDHGPPHTQMPSPIQSRSMTRASSPKSKKMVNKFDQETIDMVSQMQMRHDQLRDNYAEIWAKNMQVHYFTPSKKLQNMRQQAIDLKKLGEKSSFNRMLQECEILETQETEAAQERYEHDFAVAQQKVEEKQYMEMEIFLQERLKKRMRITNEVGSRSQSVSRRASPRNSRKNSPAKMPPLISYTNRINAMTTPTTPKTTQRRDITTPVKTGTSNSNANNNTKKRRHHHRNNEKAFNEQALPKFREENTQVSLSDDDENEDIPFDPIEPPTVNLPPISMSASPERRTNSPKTPKT